MSTVAEIKAAISALNPAERAEMARFLRNLDGDQWERQMSDDAEPGGKLHRLKQSAEAGAANGALRDFPGSPRNEFQGG